MKQARRSKQMSERCERMSERANGQTSGQVLTSGFPVALDHSATEIPIHFPLRRIKGSFLPLEDVITKFFLFCFCFCFFPSLELWRSKASSFYLPLFCVSNQLITDQHCIFCLLSCLKDAPKSLMRTDGPTDGRTDRRTDLL